MRTRNTMIILLISIIGVVAFATYASADGSRSDDHHLIGVNLTASPAVNDRLYIPVYTAGNVRRVNLNIEIAESGGTGNDLFQVEFMDNEAILYKLSHVTHYDTYSIASTTNPVNTYTRTFEINVSKGWKEGIYWFSVEKELSGNHYCWLDYTMVYNTSEPSSGGLIMDRIQDLEDAVTSINENIQTLSTAVDELQIEVDDVRTLLGALNDTMHKRFEEIEDLIDEMNTSIREDIDEDIRQGLTELEDELRDEIDALNESFYLDIQELEQVLENAVKVQNAEIEEMSSKLNSTYDQLTALEDDVEENQQEITALQRVISVLENNITKLEKKDKDEGPSSSLQIVAGIISGVIAGALVAVIVSSRMMRKDD